MKLLLKACGMAMIAPFESASRAAHGHARRFIGRTFDPKLGKAGGWPPVAGDTEVVLDENDEEFLIHVSEYRTACRDGDIEPGDDATAQALGVPWKAPSAAQKSGPKGDAEKT